MFSDIPQDHLRYLKILKEFLRFFSRGGGGGNFNLSQILLRILVRLSTSFGDSYALKGTL